MGCTHSVSAGAPGAEAAAAGTATAAAAATTTPGALPPPPADANNNKGKAPTSSAVNALLEQARKTVDAVAGVAAAATSPAAKTPASSAPGPAPATKQNASPSADVLGRGAKDDIRSLFTFGRVLGKGQFGVTRIVTDPLTGKQHACKVIPKRKLVGKEDAEDVRREVRVLHHLSGHPHVVTFRGAYEDSQAVYIVMELCRGGELFDAIARRGHFREKEAARCVATLLSVVAHCHGMCVALRDLKPENVLFLHEPGVAVGSGEGEGGGETSGGTGGGGDGGGGGGVAAFCDAAPLGPGWPRHLKVIDFGLSCFVSATDPAPLSELVGSPFYMAPEVLRRSYGRAADVWSVGVIAYILLCGSPPFYGASTAAIFRAVAHDGLDLASPPWPGVSEPAKDFVRRLLTRDPARRLTAAQALRHEWIVAATGGGGGASGAAPSPSFAPNNNNNNNSNNASSSAAADAYYSQQQPEILARLRRFAGMGRLRREALRVVAAALPPEEVEGLRAVFRDLDRDGSGAISLEELRQGLRARGATVADDELKRLVASVDLDGSQQLDWGEFLTATVFFGKLERHDRLLAAFQHFDADGSGHITEAELREGLSRAVAAQAGAGAGGGGGAGAFGLGAVGGGGGGGAAGGGRGGGVVPDAELNEMLASIDRDGDGKISYEEFCALLLGQQQQGQGGAQQGQRQQGAGAKADEEEEGDDEDEGEEAGARGGGRRHHHRRRHRHHKKRRSGGDGEGGDEDEAAGSAGEEEQQQQQQQEAEQQPRSRRGGGGAHSGHGGAQGLSMVTAARGAVWLDEAALAAAVGKSQ